MKNLTNGAVADRTQRRSTVSKSADDAAMFGDIPKVRSPTKLPSLQSEGKRSTFYDSRNTSGVDDSVNTSPPPPPPPREEKGGVVDTFGYFSTHRVHPNYYNELERTSKTTNYYEKRSTSRSQSVHSNHGKATVRGFTGKRDLLDEEQPAPRYSTQRSKSMNSNASNTNSSRGQSVTAAQS
ncbi:hypothetical protein AGDE_16072 [Angomonas deanei]|uniref:Uncharacterized protein n=1 Tax=Angomonas deanei TaxID=59799 RepID=A0A7G2CKL3_9TRYP|nr:hypothetical protein AGDE_16072 [Angomonas deanei]CAD2219481.1 hypothetical protein, conserved [Angomonas deanei]|eukprot:EPY17786.1 hypothetical protein AGDE_16072 [Angomonas deanei]